MSLTRRIQLTLPDAAWRESKRQAALDFYHESTKERKHEKGRKRRLSGTGLATIRPQPLSLVFHLENKTLEKALDPEHPGPHFLLLFS